MDRTKLIIGGVGAVAGSFAGWFWGSLEGVLTVLIVMICADYITGLSAAVYNNVQNSAVGFRGIIKKVVLFLVAGVANVVDVHMLKGAGVLRDAVFCFFIANEGLSILENVGKMGIEFPQSLKDFFEKLKDKGDDDEEDKQ